jgi:hypothetical protein
MFRIEDPEVFWLNVTNLGLGILCAICIAVVIGGTVRELALRRHRVLGRVFEFDPHTLRLPELGTTMADGGLPLDPEPKTTIESLEEPVRPPAARGIRWLFSRKRSRS